MLGIEILDSFQDLFFQGRCKPRFIMWLEEDPVYVGSLGRTVALYAWVQEQGDDI